jgi:selenocysteine lyase/cysteine desulfurase
MKTAPDHVPLDEKLGDPATLYGSSPVLTRRHLLGASMAGVVAGLPLYSAAAGAIDPWELVRRQFLIDDDLIYLNTGTYGPSSREVAAAECRGREAMNRDFNRYFYDQFIDERFVGLVDRVAAFIGAGRNDIAFTSGATEGMNYVANGLELSAGDEVLTTTHEHQAGIYPWLLLAKRRGIRVRQLPLPTPVENAAQILNLFNDAIGERTRVLSFCHIQYTDGCRLPVVELCRLARDRGLTSVVDAAQSVGMLDFAVRDLGCDLFVTSLHKWLCGPYGTGLMFIDERIRDHFWPTVVEGREGWDTADRFGRDPGEPSIDFAPAWPTTMIKYATNLHYYGPLFWALQSAVELQELIGRDTVEARTHALAQRVRDGLAAFDGSRILSPEPPALRSAITSFTVDGIQPAALRKELKAQRIVTRYVGHKPFGFEANRVCTHVFNTEDQIDRLLDAVHSIAKRGMRGV